MHDGLPSRYQDMSFYFAMGFQGYVFYSWNFPMLAASRTTYHAFHNAVMSRSFSRDPTDVLHPAVRFLHSAYSKPLHVKGPVPNWVQAGGIPTRTQVSRDPQFQEFGVLEPPITFTPFEKFVQWSMDRNPEWRADRWNSLPSVLVLGNPAGHNVFPQPLFQESFADREGHKSDWIPHHVKDPYGRLERDPDSFLNSAMTLLSMLRSWDSRKRFWMRSLSLYTSWKPILT